MADARFPRRSATIFNLVQIVRRRRPNVSTMDLEKSEGNAGAIPKQMLPLKDLDLSFDLVHWLSFTGPSDLGH